jgi:hypothetical protein
MPTTAKWSDDMDISENPAPGKPAPVRPAKWAQLGTERRAGFYAVRLAAIRAEISFLHTAPYGYGLLNGPHRRQRDELILQGFAADLSARLVEAAS